MSGRLQDLALFPAYEAVEVVEQEDGEVDRHGDVGRRTTLVSALSISAATMSTTASEASQRHHSRRVSDLMGLFMVFSFRIKA